MKRLVYIAIASLSLIFYGCSNEGPVGPPGPEGPRGPEGPQGSAGESGFVFEYENIDFTGPDYEVFLNYPNDFEGLASDVALVYLLWGVDQDLEIWRPLPQTTILPEGTLVYNYDFTLQDVRLFLQADFSLDQLTAIDTDDWIARIVIVPGEFWASNRIGGQIDYEVVKEAFGLPDLKAHQNVIERRSIQ
jgi:hypothetical protein